MKVHARDLIIACMIVSLSLTYTHRTRLIGQNGTASVSEEKEEMLMHTACMHMHTHTDR